MTTRITTTIAACSLAALITAWLLLWRDGWCYALAVVAIAAAVIVGGRLP